jgi:hypothetical protein
MKSPDIDKWILAMQEEHCSIQDADVWKVHNIEGRLIGRNGLSKLKFLICLYFCV